MENVIVRDGNVRVLVVFLSQDSDMARTSRLADCFVHCFNTNLVEESSNVNMHETNAFKVTEVNK